MDVIQPPYATLALIGTSRPHAPLAEDILAIKLNITGRELTEYQRVKFAETLLPMYQARAKTRKAANLPSAATAALGSSAGRSDDQAAETAGLGSGDTLRRKQAQHEKVKASPLAEELLGHLEAGAITLAQAVKRIDEADEERQKAVKEREEAREKTKRETERRKEAERDLNTMVENRDQVYQELTEKLEAAETENGGVREVARREAWADIFSLAKAQAEKQDLSLSMSELSQIAYRLDPEIAEIFSERQPSPEAHKAIASIIGDPLKSRVGDAIETRTHARITLRPIEDLRHAVYNLSKVTPHDAHEAWGNTEHRDALETVLEGTLSAISAFTAEVRSAGATTLKLVK